MENVLGSNGQQLPNNHNHFDASSQVKHAIYCSNFISLRFFRNLETRNLKHFLLLNGRAHMWDAMSDAFNPQFSLFILSASNILSPLDSQHHQSFSDLLFIFLLIHIFSPSSFLPSTTFQNVCAVCLLRLAMHRTTRSMAGVMSESLRRELHLKSIHCNCSSRAQKK